MTPSDTRAGPETPYGYTRDQVAPPLSVRYTPEAAPVLVPSRYTFALRTKGAVVKPTPAGSVDDRSTQVDPPLLDRYSADASCFPDSKVLLVGSLRSTLTKSLARRS